MVGRYSRLVTLCYVPSDLYRASCDDSAMVYNKLSSLLLFSMQEWKLHRVK
ncbi:hypothetical protein M0804_000059 [Polistes exclamans]|nr:hypothetical protein M0804_000059 [Polistes exclamans]